MSESTRPLPEVAIEDIHIRPLREEDLEGLEWEGEFRHFRRMYADAYRRMQVGLNLMWVAESAGFIIGQVFIQLKCDRAELCDGFSRAYLYGFRVRPQYRGQGLGSRMMDTVETDLLERGFEFLTLNVARDNLNAQRLYRKRGYRIIAPEPGEWQYVDHRGFLIHVHEPAWRMEKILRG